MAIIKISDKKLVFLLITVLILSGISFFVSRNIKTGKVVSKEFGGKIIRVESNSIFLRGMFRFPERPNLSRDMGEVDIEVVVTPETQLLKTALYWPKAEELGPNKTFDPATLRREHKQGSFEEIQRDKPDLLVFAKKNIFLKKKFKAQKIEYFEYIFP